MEIKSINIDDLEPNTWNPNVLDINKYTILVNNIKKDKAMLQPILVRPFNNKYQIIDGYHRWKASKEAGLKEIDCVVIDADLTESKLKTLSFNAIRGENDEELLKDLIKDLEKEDIDITKLEKETGLFKEDINNIENDTNIPLSDNVRDGLLDNVVIYKIIIPKNKDNDFKKAIKLTGIKDISLALLDIIDLYLFNNKNDK